MADTTHSEANTPDRSASEVLLAQARATIPDSVNFGRISENRRLYLDEQATRYISAADTDPSTPARSLDYNSFAGMLNHLSDRRDLNDLEKAYVWSSVADRKGEADNLRNGFQNGEYSISLEGSKDEIRDSQPFRQWNTPNHSVLSFADGYHGFGNPQPGENQSLAYLSREDANQRIRNHESIPFVNVSLNDGDIQASQRLVAAFRQYRTSDWGDKFEAFANEWQTQMLETRGQDARDIGQRFSDLGGRAPSQQLSYDPSNTSPALALDAGSRQTLAVASSGLQSMSGREQLALNTPDGENKLGMLLAADMNRRNIVEPTHFFPNQDHSRVFASAGDPTLPQTPVANAAVADANAKSMPEVVAQLNRSQVERDANQLVVAQNTVDREQSAPSHGARV
jgi:hypothetical protein